MKTLFRLLGCAALTIGTASLSMAGPPSGYYETLRNENQFRKLKAGDKIAYVCNQCKTVSEVTIDSSAQAMEHCKEGAAVRCPMCKASVKVTTKGFVKNQSAQREVIYVNDKGEECMFIAKVVDKK